MRTLDELQDGLDANLAWRRVELHALRAAARSVRARALDAQCRAGVAMLYAHWEGYARFALSSYLQYVARRRLLYSELDPAFVVRGAAHEVRGHGMSQSVLEIERTRWILESSSGRCRISPRTEIDTRSNLSSEVCEELLLTLGLDGSSFATKPHFIDYSLLKARNEIAHGQWFGIDLKSYEELHQEVLALLETMRQHILTAADRRAYRR